MAGRVTHYTAYCIQAHTHTTVSVFKWEDNTCRLFVLCVLERPLTVDLFDISARGDRFPGIELPNQ